MLDYYCDTNVAWTNSLIHLLVKIFMDISIMSERPFKVGDVVKLKSNGPEMTVQRVLPGNLSVDCIYFDGKEFIKKSFKDSLLIKIR